MSKERVTFIVLVSLSVVSFFIAIVTFRESSRFDLKKVDSIVGQVKEAAIRERLIRGLKVNRPQTVFWFRLTRSTQNFAIHIPSGAYSDLERGVRSGDTIKVYYRPTSDQFNMDVFQVEGKAKVLFSYKEYKEQTSNKAGYMLIGGIVILLIAIVGYTKFNTEVSNAANISFAQYGFLKKF